MYKRNKGYTLLELITVISIIGIMSTIAVPNLINFSDAWILKSTAQMIAQDIRCVQNKSINQCKSHIYVLNTKKFYYYIKPNDSTAPIIKTVELDPRIIEINSTLKDKPGSHIIKELIFSETGAPNQAGTIEFKTVKSYIKLTVELATGRVHIYD